MKYLESLSNLDEISIIDSFSNDNTWSIICDFSRKTKKKFVFKQQKFESFGKQKNDCMEMATGHWILLIDADETYGYQLNRLLGDLKKDDPTNLNNINAIRIRTFQTFIDKYHYSNPDWLDPHIRIWRKHLFKYHGDCHERLQDAQGRDMHTCYDKDVLTLHDTEEYKQIYMLHHQQLKSSEALLHKGERWQQLGMLEKSAEQDLPFKVTSWADQKRDSPRTCQSHEIPKEFWDYET